MHVLIISTNQCSSPAPVMPAGACLVAEAAERAGHNVALLDLMFQPDPERTLADLLRKAEYDVIGLSIRNIDNTDMHSRAFYIPEAEALVRVVRRLSGARLVLGGAALSVMPGEIMQFLGADCAVVGEGETAFPALLSSLERGTSWEDLPGIASFERGRFRSNPGMSPGSCSAPSYKKWIDLRAYRSRMSTAPLQSKLGCRFHCVYCTYRKIEGDRHRLFDPDSVAAAATSLVAQGMSSIEFVDNVFNDPPDHAAAVCESLIRTGVRARFQSLELNPACFDDQLVTVMEKAGFAGMGITVESASDRVLQGLGKGFSARDVHRAAEIVKRHDIPCVWIFMLGGPGETRETVQETISFAQRNVVPGRDAAFFGIGVRIYPGTGLEAIARREGVLPETGSDMLTPVFYVAPGLDAGWLHSQVSQALGRNMNFISIDSFCNPWLPVVNRVVSWAGVRPPIWRYTARIRRTLRMIGVDA